MFEIFLQWIFIGLVSLGWGYLIPFKTSSPKMAPSFLLIMRSMLGLLTLTIALSLLHFWVPISSGWLLLFISVMSVVFLNIHRPELPRVPQLNWQDAFFCIFLIGIWYKSAGPIGSLDTGAYHLPLIRWFEQYPIVDGLANLHARFGFNYHYHLVSAFFGLDGVSGTTLHGMNGYLFVLTALMLYILYRGESKTWDRIFYVIALAALALITNGMNSFSPDFPVASYQIVILSFLFYAYRQKSLEQYYPILICLSLALIPWKVSSFTLFLFLLLFINKGFFTRHILTTTIVIGLLVFIPYFIRNYHISGYVVYPLSSLDFFDPIWKVTKKFVDFERVAVRNYALGLPVYYLGHVHYDGALFSNWLMRMKSLNTAGYLAVILFGINIIILFAALVLFGKRSSSSRKFYTLYFIGFLAALVVWFLLGPDPRFSYGYLVPMTGFTAFMFAKSLKFSPRLSRLLGGMSVAIAALLMWLSIFGWGASSGLGYTQGDGLYVLRQAPYPVSDAVKEKQQGIEIYKSTRDGRCWECPLPCSYPNDVFIIRDPQDISRGFLPSSQKTEK